MDYKKIIPNHKLRLKILKSLSWIPDVFMLKVQYFIKFGRILNLQSPKRFTEKLQWYKLNYQKKLMTMCSDKFSVREYVASKGLSANLNQLYGVYESVEDIPFETLPKKYVIKTTNGSDTVLFCYNKVELNLNDVKYKLKDWLKRDLFSYSREWCYKNIKPKVIIEKLLEDKNNQFNGINDYKFICFNGKAEYIVLDVDRQIGHKRNFYDTNWNYIDVSSDRPNFKDCVPKPDNLDEMLKIANILCKDFPFVRVDLYSIDSKIIFGELTFYPWTGYVPFYPDSFDYLLGQKFKLPDEK